MNKSIKRELFWTFLISIIIILGLAWIFISFFAEKYYETEKIKNMSKYVNNIKDILQNKESDTDKKNKLDIINLQSGGNIVIFNRDGQLSYIGDIEINKGGRMHGRMMGGNFINLLRNTELKGNENRFYGKTNRFIGNMEWLIYGEKDEFKNTIFIYIPFYSISESVTIIQKLLGYIVILALIFAFAVSYILSRRITNPILKLNKIALEMGRLNFSLRYKEKREDEIGQLGNTLNHLTETLEETINQLQVELNKEKELEQLRKQFVAQVSHELQTPLAVINGYIEALQDDIADTEQEKQYYYSIIDDETNKMSKIVRDLLDLSQLESGAFNIKKEEIDFGVLMSMIYNKFCKIAKNTGIKLTKKGMKKGLFVLGDKIRLEQAVTNLLHNALKNTYKEGKINLILENKEDIIQLKVINTGEHIEESDLPYIWESFYKAKNKHQKKGTGLGLAITKHILLLHGGSYFVQNLDEGVCFGFELKRLRR